MLTHFETLPLASFLIVVREPNSTLGAGSVDSIGLDRVVHCESCGSLVPNTIEQRRLEIQTVKSDQVEYMSTPALEATLIRTRGTSPAIISFIKVSYRSALSNASSYLVAAFLPHDLRYIRVPVRFSAGIEYAH